MEKVTSKQKCLLLLAGLIIVFFIFFPPFRIVSLEESKVLDLADVFDPVKYARQFWQEQLPLSYKNAYDAQEVLNAVKNDLKDAKERYGQTTGLGGPCHFLLQDTGTITSIETRQIEVSLSTQDNDNKIYLMTSMIFGNEVLNATNIISRSQFQKTNDYNAVSAEVNSIVEKELVKPFLSQVKIGDSISFIGCSEGITGSDSAVEFLLVPVKLEVE